MSSVAVKRPIFSFNRFPFVDPVLGPEMKSTGEMMFQGQDFEEVSLKLHRYGYGLNQRDQKVILLINDGEPRLDELADELKNLGFEVYHLKENNITHSVIEAIKRQEFKCVIHMGPLQKSCYNIRKSILSTNTPELTTRLDVKYIVHSLFNKTSDLTFFSLQEAQMLSQEGKKLNENIQVELLDIGRV